MKQTLKYTGIVLIKVAILNAILMIVFNLMFVPSDKPMEQGLGLLAIMISLGCFCIGWEDVADINKVFANKTDSVLKAIIGTVLITANICFLTYYSYGLITWERDLWGLMLFMVAIVVILITNIEIVKV